MYELCVITAGVEKTLTASIAAKSAKKSIIMVVNFTHFCDLCGRKLFFLCVFARTLYVISVMTTGNARIFLLELVSQSKRDAPGCWKNPCECQSVHSPHVKLLILVRQRYNRTQPGYRYKTAPIFHAQISRHSRNPWWDWRHRRISGPWNWPRPSPHFSPGGIGY